MRRKRIAAIDVGTTKVCTIIADTGNEGDLRILGVGITPSEGMHKGMISDVNVAKYSIRHSVQLAERTAGRKIDSAVVGITGRHITSTNKLGAISIARNDQLVRPADLRRVMSVARNIPLPNEHKLIHVIPRSYSVDGQTGVSNPIGMHGTRLDMEAHVISAAVASIKNMTKCIRSVGVEIDDLVLEPLASAMAVLRPEEKENGVILADIGGGTTDIAIYKNNTVYHTAVLPVAGTQVTRDISLGLGVSFDTAEEMKKKYGDVTPADARDSSDKRPVSKEGQNVAYGELSDIIRMRAEEMIRLIMLELPQNDLESLVPAGLVLTGGGAYLKGIDLLAEQITSLPVRIGVPSRLEGVSDALQHPSYATSEGLLLWKLQNQGEHSDGREKEVGLMGMVGKLLRFFR